MFRIFCIFFFFFSSFLSANQIELLADNIAKNNDIVTANGSVVVYAKDYFLKSNRARYDLKTEQLELFGDVILIKNGIQSIKTQYAKINLNNNLGEFEPFFTFEQNDKLWLECQSAKSQEQFYITKNSIVSSCDVEKPDWKIGFSEGKLSKSSKYLYLKHAIFYARDIPIFYLPYFAISTDTTRRTGLLIPTVELRSDEGFTIRQPIYIAPHHWWDLEFEPVWMLKRGFGLVSSFRFADTKYSSGSVTAGYFHDKTSYKEKENLKNQDHYGIKIDYLNSNIIEDFVMKKLNKSIDDGFRLDFSYLNDIDYLNLEKNNNSSDNLITSKLDYFISDQKNYLGLHGRYYIDTDKVSNKDTLQELPLLRYHRYVDKLFWDNLLYSFDLQYHHFYRKEGMGANQVEAYLPLVLHFDLFDDYLQASVSENVYLTSVNYTNIRKKSESLNKNFHKFSLMTDLSKLYDIFFHTIRLNADFIIPSWENGKLSEDFIATNKQESKKINFELEQFFFDQFGKKKFKHNLQNGINFEKNEYRYEDIKNDLEYYYNDNLSLFSSLVYSHKNRHFSKIQHTFEYQNDLYSFDLSHIILDEEKQSERLNYFSSNLSAKWRNFLFFAGFDYDFSYKYSKSWQLGYTFKKNCWNYTFKYFEDEDPKQTEFGSEGERKRGFIFMFELYPLGGSSYAFKS